MTATPTLFQHDLAVRLAQRAYDRAEAVAAEAAAALAAAVLARAAFTPISPTKENLHD